MYRLAQAIPAITVSFTKIPHELSHVANAAIHGSNTNHMTL